MIKFMVLGAPRSGTTWSSNWLTTEYLLCLHDPILQNTPEEIEDLVFDTPFGLACTGLPLHPEWVNRQRCPKVILHRPRAEIDASLVAIGLTPLGKQWDDALGRLDGLHVPYQDLFEQRTAEVIWKHLMPEWIRFSTDRHALLTQMHVEPAFGRVRIQPHAARAFAQHVREALCA